MPQDFKSFAVRPVTGAFDTLHSVDEIGFGNWRIVKNAVTRTIRNRQVGGGWRRLFADDDIYNNQDLHDQLTSQLSFRDSYLAHAMGGGGLAGFGYPYFSPAYSDTDVTLWPPAQGPYCPAYVGDFPDNLYQGCDIFYWFVGYPFNLWDGALYPGACNEGYPFYYVDSYFYTSCRVFYPGTDWPGFSYGPVFPIYESHFSYDYEYCGPYLHYRPGCREAITLLSEIITEAGRKLIAGTMSRVYEYNQSSGNWRILIDGLGNAGYTPGQCTCNDVRGMAATMGGYFVYTNNIDPPFLYFVGDPNSGCEQAALQEITDLVALNITAAGGVVSWKGFMIFFDITEDGVREGGTVLWSDLEDPASYIESDTSLAGRATIAVGETILNAAPLGNWLIFYTDKSIYRCTLVGGEDVFNFERIYQGGNALKYKFSLTNTGDTHIYVGESDIYTYTQFDTRPINVAWVTKAAGMIFHGITEDDATYAELNRDACNLVTGWWSEETHEAFFSWPTGNNVCPNVTLRLNTKFNTADLLDHGFTSGMTFRQDVRPTVGEWIEDMGICPRGSKVAMEDKDGRVCVGLGSAVVNPPLYIRNPTEDPNLPVHAQSLCARLAGLMMSDFCQDCPAPTTLIAASAMDFALKQLEDDVYYREMIGGTVASYDAISCDEETYLHMGYETVFQQGAEMYRSADEKMIKRITVEAEPQDTATPSTMECDIGYAPTPSCFTWKPIRSLTFECQTDFTPAQHAANRTRPDGVFNFPTWRRGKFIAARFRIVNMGGGGTVSGLELELKNWGQPDSP